MFSWWVDLPGWLRLAVALAFLAASTVLWLLGWFWPWGWAVGAVLLLFCGRSDSEKNGYHF